ncbi:MAG: hypothetical protein ACREQ9_17520, partial [Candidatus Binatia bacterium]
LDERASDPEEVSDADREIYLRQRQTFRPLEEIPERQRIVVDTESGLDAAPEAVAEALGRES